MQVRDLLADISREFPEFKLVPKASSKLMRVANTLLKVVTFGSMKKFMDMTTTLGFTVYTPPGWDDLSDITKEEILRHERVHMRQRVKYGVWFYLLYALLPLPVLFAYFRMKFEQEAYAESMRCAAQHYGISSIDNAKYKEWMISHFTGSSYLWTWVLRRQVETWYMLTVSLLRIEIEGIKHQSL